MLSSLPSHYIELDSYTCAVTVDLPSAGTQPPAMQQETNGNKRQKLKTKGKDKTALFSSNNCFYEKQTK